MDAAVVGEEDDNGAFAEAEIVDGGEEAADGVIEMLDRGEVGGIMEADGGRAAGEVLGDEGGRGGDFAVDRVVREVEEPRGCWSEYNRRRSRSHRNPCPSAAAAGSRNCARRNTRKDRCSGDPVGAALQVADFQRL